MRFGDIHGLARAAADLDHLGQRATQHRRAVAATAATLTGQGAWRGDAATTFQQRADTIDTHLAGVASAATRTSGILRRLATELDAARETADQARRAGLAAGITVTHDYQVAPVIGDPDGCDLTHSPDARRVRQGVELAAQQAQQAWQVAAAHLQEVWSPYLDFLQGLGTADKLWTAASAPAALAGIWAERHKDARGLVEQTTGRGAQRRAWQQAAKVGERLDDANRVADRLPWSPVAKWLDDANPQLPRQIARVPGARTVPLVSIGAAVVGTKADVEQGEPLDRAVAANAAAGAAGIGVSVAAGMLATGPAGLVAVGVVVVGYGVGTAVHSFIAHGDLREFAQDWGAATSAAGKAWDAITPW